MNILVYNNIFATKGTEYLIVIGFLLLLIPFWIILNRKSNVVQEIKNSIGNLTLTSLNIPRGLFYNKNHTWSTIEKSGLARIGLDDFLVKTVGEANVNFLKDPGEKIEKNDNIAEICQNGKRLKIKSPISGILNSVNTLLERDKNILHEKPYEKGWLLAIEPRNWKSESQNFYMADEATKWISLEIDKLKDFLSRSISKHSGLQSLPVYQEGGELKEDVLQDMNSDIWADFQKEFLE